MTGDALDIAPPRIFVAIAAYRDPELQWTLRDLFERARRPDRIEVGVYWQSLPAEDGHCLAEPPPRPAQVRIDEAHARWSTGAGAARHAAAALWCGEPYVLMVDSHTRFADGWDATLVEMHRHLPSPQAVLSTFPPGYTPPDDRKTDWVFGIGVKRLRDDGLPALIGRPIKLPDAPGDPLPGVFATPRCLFGPGHLLDTLMPDPHLYHFGEDLDWSTRLYTHGWDVYHPHLPVVFHKWSRSGRPIHHQDHPDWREANDRSIARMRHKLGLETSDDPAVIAELDQYGLGDARTLADFQARSGLDLAAGRVEPRAEDGRRYPLTPIARQRLVTTARPWSRYGHSPATAPTIRPPTRGTDEWLLYDDFLPEDDFQAVLDSVRQLDYKHINTRDKISRVWRIGDGFPLRSVDDLSRPAGAKSLPASLADDSRWQALGRFADAISALMPDPQVQRMVGAPEEDWDRFTVTSWMYPRGTGLSLHHDGTAGYRGAYVYFLNPEWDIHWGGLLLVFEGEANASFQANRPPPSQKLAHHRRKWIEHEAERAAVWEPGMSRCILPRANRLVLLHPETRHLVTRVDAAAGDRVRMSLAGFFQAKRGR